MANPIIPDPANPTINPTTPPVGGVPTDPPAPPTPPAPTPPAPPASDDISKMTTEQLREMVEKERRERQNANKEAQELRRRATSAEADLKKRQEAEMTELEKAQARAKELEDQLTQSNRQNQDARIMVTASKLGFNDPTDAIALINRTDLAADEKNLESLLKDVLKAKPYLGKAKGTLPGTSPLNPGDGTQALDEKQKQEKAVSMFPTIGRLVGKK